VIQLGQIFGCWVIFCPAGNTNGSLSTHSSSSRPAAGQQQQQRMVCSAVQRQGSLTPYVTTMLQFCHNKKHFSMTSGTLERMPNAG
jgi:hypothetical protein